MSAPRPKIELVRQNEHYDQMQFEALDRAAKRLSFLSEASRRLSSALTNQECFQELLQLMVPEFCDAATISLLTENGEIKRVAFLHVDPRKQQTAETVLSQYPPALQDSYGTGQVIRTGQSEFDPGVDSHVEDFLRAVRYPEVRELMRSMNVRSRAAVPLKAHGKILGALWMTVTSNSGRRFTEDDLKLAEEVANRAALSVYHLFAHEKASKNLERLEVERELRESYLNQLRHDVLSVLTVANASAEMILRQDPEKCGVFAARIIGALERATEMIKRAPSEAA